MNYQKTRNIMEAMFVTLVCIFLTIPNNVYANVINKVHNKHMIEIKAEDERIIDEYIIEKNGIPYFDIDKANRENESEEILDVGKSFNDFSFHMNSTEKISSIEIPLPVRGNWCGPYYGSGKPIDLLDEGCMIHDGCYEHGKKNCSCNNRLINHINRYYNQMGSKEKAMAWAIKLYFTSENKRNGC